MWAEKGREGALKEMIFITYLQELRGESHFSASCHHQYTPQSPSHNWHIVYWQNSDLKEITLSHCQQGGHSLMIGGD